MALATIDENGLHLPDYPTVLEDVKARFRGIYGDDLYLGPDSQFSTVTQRDLYWKGVYRINNRQGKIPGWSRHWNASLEHLTTPPKILLLE